MFIEIERELDEAESKLGVMVGMSVISHKVNTGTGGGQ
jgi:hypothetical protein